MSIVADLLASIERFCAETDTTESAFSRRAANDGKFVRRLRNGADVNVGTVERIHAFIASERERLGLPKRATGRASAKGVPVRPRARSQSFRGQGAQARPRAA